ncbi:MAG TPA: hypothetical protein VLC98_10180 [Phnomibacter sp.]|nr:hypothetical protein [Phnomibacter sp.]
MKKLLIMICAGISLLMVGCTKNDIPTFTAAQIEFDAASWNANGGGLTYPMMTRVPAYNAATTSSNGALITRTTGTIKLRVNVVGAQSSTDRNFTVKFNQAESTGNPGVHFAPVAATGVIPANSSFGYVDFVILNPGPGTGTATAVLELTDNSVFKPSANYAKIGLSIALN